MSVIQKIGQFSEDHPVVFTIATTSTIIGALVVASKVHKATEVNRIISEAAKHGSTSFAINTWNPKTHATFTMELVDKLSTEEIARSFSEMFAKSEIVDVMVTIKK